MIDQEAVVKVITYGTFDMLHEGHIRLLQRARELGDYLIVGVTTDQYDETRGKLNVRDDLMRRVANVQASGLADEVIIEDYEGQKINDIQQHSAEIFAIGSDWLGKFDYLNDYCKVVYLDRTVGVSSTQRRAETLGITRLGVAGTGRASQHFLGEALRVSGLEIEAAFSPRGKAAAEFAESNDIPQHFSDYDAFLNSVDAVYIASPHECHYKQVQRALERDVHVICEKPITLSRAQTEALYELARRRGKVLLEAVQTAYCPGFIRLVALARSGVIGHVRCVDATFTRLAQMPSREMTAPYGGSMTELASYPLLAISKILGSSPKKWSFDTFSDDSQLDHFSRIHLNYERAIASATVGIGAMSEGHLTIAGSAGSIYVPAPWWKTTDIFLRFDDSSRNQSYHFPFVGDGRSYEIAEFVSMIQSGKLSTFKMRAEDSQFISTLMEEFRLSTGSHEVERLDKALSKVSTPSDTVMEDVSMLTSASAGGS